ncbi:hypothetical protein NUH88_21655 [Nisaea acidiphila]|uniref:Glycosyltransferase n=1 Tax=Nisaea acidiphila TaxID=1862145 RepID=A0A9J7AX04_9PROT|nr:glycosyltransferase [Nisaea acidiphila]UUX49981.1 hypothetical protein NUH88_21655 [Nisaea acidiphila]
MNWYFCCNEEGLSKYETSIRIAVASARRNTSLKPKIVYDGGRNELTGWLESQGVEIIEARTPLYEDILKQEDRPGYRRRIAHGVYLRFEVANFEKDEPFCLYTDSDVMFLSDPARGDLHPTTFAAAPEMDPHDWSYFNSGVMLMNVACFRGEYDALMEYSRKRLGQTIAYDQGALNEFFKDNWDRLPITWNWKPYWGLNDEAVVLHFHGPKYETIKFLIDGGEEQVVHEAWQTLFDHNPEAYERYLRMAESYLS